MSESFLLFSVRILGVFVRWLPLSAATILGRSVGNILWIVDRKHRLIVFRHLRTAFGHEMPMARLESLTRQCFQHYVLHAIDVLRLPLMDRRYCAEHIQLEGREHIDHARTHNRGVILVSMHYGSWEIGNLGGILLDLPFKVLIKPQRHARLNALLHAYRNVQGLTTVDRGMAMRNIIRALHRNEAILMVADQGGQEGMRVPFFGREASMAAGALRIARKYDVPVCFAHVFRREEGKWRIVIDKPFALQRTDDEQQDLRTGLQDMVARMEEIIYKDPAQYLWFYKVWKYSRQRSVLIVSDGKAGHARQSECVALCLSDALREEGYRVTNQIVPLAFRSSIAARFLMLLSRFIPASVKLLQVCMTAECFNRLMSGAHDYIISCGAASAPVNLQVGNINGARTICLLRPGFLSWRQFDMLFQPQHDLPDTRRPNVVVTQGAPNVVSESYLANQREGLLRRFPHLGQAHRRHIGIFIGGDTRKYMFSEQKIRMVMAQIREVAHELQADLIITTSRRTPEKTEQWLEREFKKDPQCLLLVLANKANVPEAVGGILALSDLVVVSGDSVSMICEAATAGKGVVVFPPTDNLRVWQRHKHSRCIEGLHRGNYILSTDARHLRVAIYDMLKGKMRTQPLSDHQTIMSAVKTIV